MEYLKLLTKLAKTEKSYIEAGHLEEVKIGKC